MFPYCSRRQLLQIGSLVFVCPLAHSSMLGGIAARMVLKDESVSFVFVEYENREFPMTTMPVGQADGVERLERDRKTVKTPESRHFSAVITRVIGNLSYYIDLEIALLISSHHDLRLTP
jgi:hypothetical protein